MSLPPVRIIPRSEWGARTPKRRTRIYPANMPTPELWEHHTVGDYRGAAGIRAIQNFHMDGRGWSDIAYNWIIDRRTREIYEGRGPGIMGGHTKGHNTHSHAICITGNFELYQPPDPLLWTIAALVAHGHDQRWWRERKLTGGHRDASGAETLCPGKYLYLAIPRINRYANSEDTTVQQEHVERIERAVAELGYTVTVGDNDLEREALAVENMVEGINNLMAQVADLKARDAQRQGEMDALTARVGAMQGWVQNVGGVLGDVLRDLDIVLPDKTG